MSPQTALTVQLLLYAVAVAAALVSVARAVKLMRQVHGHPVDAAWWRTEQARQRINHMLKPLWVTPIALVLGAVAPRLMGAFHA